MDCDPASRKAKKDDTSRVTELRSSLGIFREEERLGRYGFGRVLFVAVPKRVVDRDEPKRDRSRNIGVDDAVGDVANVAAKPDRGWPSRSAAFPDRSP